MTASSSSQQQQQQPSQPQRFPMGEAQDLLGVDAVTLRKWCAEAGIVPHADTIDKRYRYLTRDQITELARRHNRMLRIEQQPQPRLTALQREVLGRLDALETTVRALVEMQEQLAARHLQLAASIERLSPGLGMTTAGAILPAPVSTRPPAPRPTPSLVYPPTHPSTSTSTSTKVSTSRNPLPTLPDDWVSARDLARRYHVPDTTFRHWIERGRWPQPQAGMWASGASGTWPITQAYDPDQQAEIARIMGVDAVPSPPSSSPSAPPPPPRQDSETPGATPGETGTEPGVGDAG